MRVDRELGYGLEDACLGTGWAVNRRTVESSKRSVPQPGMKNIEVTFWSVGVDDSNGMAFAMM